MRSDIFDNVRVDVAPDGMSVSVYPMGPYPELPVTVEDLGEVLRQRGILEGLDPAALSLLIEDWRAGTISGPRVVANGTTPRVASAPSLKRVSPPARTGDDSVELLPLFVKSQEVVFAVTKMTDQRIGRTVHGDRIDPDQRGGSMPVPGAGIKEVDGRWIATRSGFLVVSGDCIDVSSTLTHNRDLPSGDYRWVGDAEIQGNITSGTTLRVEGSIKIQGRVQDGVSIVASQDLQVSHGIEGNDTKVVAHGTMSVGAVHGSTVHADGDITVHGELHLASVRTQGALDASSKSCVVRGCRIEAVRGVSIHEIESTRHQRTTISVGTADWVNDECKSLEDEVERWETYHYRLYESFQREYRSVIGNRNKLRGLTPKAQNKFESAQREVLAEQERVDDKIRELRRRQIDLDAQRVRDESAVITIRNGAPADTRFAIRGRKYKEQGELAKGRTICVSPDSGKIHSLPTGLLESSELFA